MSDDDAEEPERSEKRDAVRQKRRRFAGLALVAGLVLAGGAFAREWPRERKIVLRFSDASTVEDVRVTWTRADEEDDPLNEDLLGTSWHFEPGKAPSSLSTAVSLPDGDYFIAITVGRAGGDARAVDRRITLADWDELTLPVP